MKFNIIIGNPPYQKEVGGVRPKEIYSDFIINSIEKNPDFCSLVTPTRWYNGVTTNMLKVREKLLTENTSIIVDYQKAEDAFENTQISGGVSYWLWNKNKKVEKCTVKHIVHDEVSIFKEKLNDEVFIRYKEGLSILEKVSQLNEIKLSETYGFWKTFSNIHINDTFDRERFNGCIKFKAKSGETSYLNIEQIEADMIDILDKYKVITGAMTPGGGVHKADNYTVINIPRIIDPYEVFSDYYYTLGVFSSLEEAKSFDSYIRTKFARVLIQLINNTTSFNINKFKYVPVQDWNETWTDEKLYKKYSLTEDEINFIDVLIKPMKDNSEKIEKDEVDFEQFMNKPEV